MSRKLIKPLGFALAVLLTVASGALAQQSGSGMSGQSGTSSPRQDIGQQPTGSSSQMGTMGMQDTINATVAEVNRQQKTVKLRMQGGETVEMKVPEQSLMNLSQGDSVQVSIRKAEGDSGSMQRSRPDSGTTSGSGTGTTPRSR